MTRHHVTQTLFRNRMGALRLGAAGLLLAVSGSVFSAHGQEPSPLERVEALGLDTAKIGRVTVYFAPADRDRAVELAALAEAAAAFFERELGISFSFGVAALAPEHWFSEFPGVPYAIPWVSVTERLLFVASSLSEGFMVCGPTPLHDRRRIDKGLLHEYGHLLEQAYFRPGNEPNTPRARVLGIGEEEIVRHPQQVIMQNRIGKDRRCSQPELFLLLGVAVAFAAAPDIAHAQTAGLLEQQLLRHIVPAARDSKQARQLALALTHATIVDVRDGSLLPNQTMVVDGERVRAVGASGVVTVPADAQVIDARGKYLIPGLWDMHTHLLWSTDEGERLWVGAPLRAVPRPADCQWRDRHPRDVGQSRHRAAGAGRS